MSNHERFRRHAIHAVICALLPLSGAVRASDFTVRQCGSEVERLFSDYLHDVNKTPNDVAQYYSQHFLATEVNMLRHSRTTQEYSKSIAVFNSILTTGRGDELLASQSKCSDKECTISATMRHGHGDAYVFEFTYVTSKNECRSMLIDREEFFIHMK